MSLEAIKEKVAKLLALSESTNENEAAIALSRAQRLITTYKLSIAECLAKGGEAFKDEPIIKDGLPLIATGRVSLWQSYICQVLASHNDCKILKYAGKGLVIFGRASDIKTVRLMLSFTIRQLWNLSPKGMGRVYSDSWYTGCISTIEKRLKEMQTEVLAQATSFGLVKYNEQGKMVDKFVNTTCNVRPAKESQATILNQAYNNGLRDGYKVNLNASKELR